MLDKMQDTEFAIGDVKFRIEKLSALAGWHLMESIRSEVGKADLGDSINPDDMIKSFAKMVAALPPEFVDDVRERLFVKVTYKTKDVKAGWLKLSDSMDMAFASLEPSAIYDLLLRCLIVNFTGSFKDILSRLKGAGLSLSQ